MAERMADEIGFTEVARGKLSIVVTEAATNLLKHAGGGQIILRCVDSRGLEVLALDRGPGMRNVVECSRDGFSTAGSAGTGLGAISRLSSTSDIYSVEGAGTVLEAYCESGQQSAVLDRSWDFASIVSPMKGETACGDSAAVHETDSVVQIMVADGLGHGPLAAEAGNAAKTTFQEIRSGPPRILEAMHHALRSTRGAAVAIAEIDPARGKLRYCGVGNIAGVIVTGESTQHMVSLSGIVGHQTIRAREFEYSWTPYSTLIMHSDGISGRWQLSNYPALLGRRSSIVAGALFRDCRKQSDDASVMVGKQRRS